MAYIKEFGIKLFILESLRKVIRKVPGNFTLSRHFIEYVDKQIIRVLEEEFSDIIGKYEKEVKITCESKQCIWTFWAQGENNLPDIVKICIASMRKNGGGMCVSLHQIIMQVILKYLFIYPKN